MRLTSTAGEVWSVTFSDLEGYFRCLTPLSPSAAVVRVHVGALAD